MICPSCGMEVADTGKFCENCGAPLPMAQDSSVEPVQTQPMPTSAYDAAPHEQAYEQASQPIAEAGYYAGAETQAFDPQQTQAYGQQGASGYAPYGGQPGQQAGPYATPQPTAQMPMPTTPAMKQGSSAPFVLSIIALVTAVLGLFPVSLVLAIIALAMNSGQKKRGEASTKQTPTFVMGLISLILSILMGVFTLLVGSAVWMALVSGDFDDVVDIPSSSSGAAGASSQSVVGTWEIELLESDDESFDSDYLEFMRGLGMKIELDVASDGTATLTVMDEVEAGTWTDKGAGSIEFVFDGETVSATLAGDKLKLMSDSMEVVLHRAPSDSSSSSASTSSSAAGGASTTTKA